MGRFVNTFCGDVGPLHGNSRILTCQRQTDQLLDHLIMATGTVFAIDTVSIDIAIDRGGFGRRWRASAAGWRWRRLGVGLLEVCF